MFETCSLDVAKILNSAMKTFYSKKYIQEEHVRFLEDEIKQVCKGILKLMHNLVSVRGVNESGRGNSHHNQKVTNNKGMLSKEYEVIYEICDWIGHQLAQLIRLLSSPSEPLSASSSLLPSSSSSFSVVVETNSSTMQLPGIGKMKTDEDR